MIIVCNGVDGVFCFRNGEGDIVFGGVPGFIDVGAVCATALR